MEDESPVTRIAEPQANFADLEFYRQGVFLDPLGDGTIAENVRHEQHKVIKYNHGRFAPNDPHSLELHGSPMRTGRDGWDQYPRPDRHQAVIDALTLGVAKNHPKSVRLFAVALDKQNLAGQDVAQVAFEQLSSRFDQFLGRLYREKNDRQRGLILFDKSATERRIQTLAREFKYTGHTFGQTHNYAELPVFLDSRASRLIQLADLVAYGIFRNFEHNDPTYYNGFLIASTVRAVSLTDFTFVSAYSALPVGS